MGGFKIEQFVTTRYAGTTANTIGIDVVENLTSVPPSIADWIYLIVELIYK